MSESNSGSLSLDALAADPARAADLSPADATEMLVRIAALQTVLLSRALHPAKSNGVSPDRLLTLQQVAERLSVPKSYAYELARQGRLPTRRFGKYVRVPEVALAEWLAGCAGGRP